MSKFFQQTIKNTLSNIFKDNINDVVFDWALYFEEHNSQFIRYEEVKNKLLKNRVSYCPIHIERIDVERQAIPDIKILSAGIQTTINIPLETHSTKAWDRKTFEDIYESIDKIIDKYNAKPIPFGDTVYDFINAEIEINYEDDKDIKGFGLEFSVKKDFEGNIYNLQKGITQGLKLMKTGDEFRIDLGKTGSPSIETIYLPYEKEFNELFIHKVNNNQVDIYLNLNKTTVTLIGSSFNIKSSKDEISSFNGTIKELFIQELEFEDIKDYEDGLITLKGLFKLPFINIDNFININNKVDYNVTSSVTGKVIETGSEGLITFTFSTLEPLTGAFSIREVEHQQFDFTFGATITKDVFNGSQVKYFIDDVELFPLSKNIGITNESVSEQMLESNISKGVNATTGSQTEFTLFYDRNTKVLELIKNLKNDYFRNQVHKLKIEYPTFEDEIDVKIVDIGINMLYADPMTFSITFDIADEIIKS